MRRLLLITCLLLSVSCVSAKKQSRAQAKTNLARAYLQEGSTESAIQELRQAVDINPRDWMAWNHLGLAYARKGKPEMAEPAFQKAVRLADERAEPHLNYGVLLFSVGRVDEAIAQYERALEDLTYRKPSLILSNLGYAYHTIGEHEQAVRVLTEAVNRAPNLCQARFNLALSQRELGRDEAALRSLKEVIELCEEPTGALYQVGMLLMERGETARGEDFLLQVIEHEPGSELADLARDALQGAEMDLRQKRKRAGLSLREVSRITGIPGDILSALEDEEGAELASGGGIDRWRVRYSRFLDEALQPAPVVEPEEDPAETTAIVTGPYRGEPIPILRAALGGLAITVITLLGLWILSLAQRDPPEPEPQAYAEAMDQNVTVRALEHTKIRVEVDGEVMLDGVLPPGRRAAFSGEDVISVYVPELKRVVIRYNGSTIKPQGNLSKGRRLVFIDDKL